MFAAELPVQFTSTHNRLEGNYNPNLAQVCFFLASGISETFNLTNIYKSPKVKTHSEYNEAFN